MGDTSAALIFYTIAFFILLCIFGIFTEIKKHEFPRTVLFCYCSLVLAFGLGLLTMNYLDFTHDEVHPVFFKTALYTVNKFDSPILFIFGQAFNALLGLIVSAAGLVGILRAITDIKFRFKE